MDLVCFAVEVEREADGRWVAEERAYPGCMAYGATRGEAVARALGVLSGHLLLLAQEHAGEVARG